MRRLIHVYAANATRADEAAPSGLHFISHATRLYGERERPGYRVVTQPTIVIRVVEVVEGDCVRGGNAPGYHQACKEDSRVQFHNIFKGVAVQWRPLNHQTS